MGSAIDALFGSQKQPSATSVPSPASSATPKSVSAIDALFAPRAMPTPAQSPSVVVAPPISVAGPRLNKIPTTTISAPDSNNALIPTAPKSNNLDSTVYDLQHADDVNTDNPIKELSQNVKSAAGNALNTFIESVKNAGQMANSSIKLAKNPDISKKIAGGLGMINAGANVAFTPVNTAMDAIRVLPEGNKIKKNLVDEGFKAFNDALVGASDVATSKLNLDPELKSNLDQTVALGVMLGIAHKGVEGVKDFRDKTIATNDVVNSAAKILDVETNKNIVGQVKKIDPETITAKYREAAHAAHPDKGGSPQEFQIVNTAKQVLEDYNNLSSSEFRAKYQSPLESVQRVLKQLPERVSEPSAPQAAPSAVDALFKSERSPEVAPETQNPTPKIEPLDAQNSPVSSVVEKTSSTPVATDNQGITPIAPPIPTAHSTLFDAVKDTVTKKSNDRIERAKSIANTQNQPSLLEDAQKSAKTHGFELSTIKRGLEGLPTHTEIQNAKSYLESNHAGKVVKVDGRNTTLTGKMSFGKAQIVGSDGKLQYVDPSKIEADTVTEQKVLDHLKKEAQKKLQSLADFHGISDTVYAQEKPVETKQSQSEKTIKPFELKSQEASKGAISFPKTEKVTLQDTPLHNQIMSELVGAQKGERFMTDGMKFGGSKSTFPKWIPEDLRLKSLLDSVSAHITNGTLPTKVDEVRLYKIVADQMNAQDDVIQDQKFVQTVRNNLYDPFATDAENAAALAKFDEEYAKLQKSQPASTKISKTEVHPVGEPVQAKEKSSSAIEEVKTEAHPKSVPTKSSKIGLSIEAKAIEKGLTRAGFGETAQYTPKVIEEQSRRIAELMQEDTQKAIDMYLGKHPMEQGLSPVLLGSALEDYALTLNDGGLLSLELSKSSLTSETSIHAQEMRMMQERNPDSAVAKMRELKKIKEEAAKKSGLNEKKVLDDIKEQIKKEKSAPKAKQTKQSWSDFVDSIAC